MAKNTPARLYKKEQITLTYNKTAVLTMGAFFFSMLMLLAFGLGSENFNYILGSCI